MDTRHKILKNDDSTKANQTFPTSIFSKFQYVVHSRPCIASAISIDAIFSASHRENHMMGAKRILRYLKGTNNYDLCYKKIDKFELKICIDVDWTANIDDRRKFDIF